MDEPTLLFYPRPLAHTFHNPPAEGSDFVCATLAFEGGASHPLARALPPLVALPLREAPGLEHTLALLFAPSTLRWLGSQDSAASADNSGPDTR